MYTVVVVCVQLVVVCVQLLVICVQLVVVCITSSENLPPHTKMGHYWAIIYNIPEHCTDMSPRIDYIVVIC